MNLKALKTEASAITPQRVSGSHNADDFHRVVPPKRVKSSAERFTVARPVESDCPRNDNPSLTKLDEPLNRTVDKPAALFGDPRLDKAVAENISLQCFIDRSLRKCLTKNDRLFMIGHLRKEVSNDPLQDWMITPLPLLPQEKLRNLSLALNGNGPSERTSNPGQLGGRLDKRESGTEPLRSVIRDDDCESEVGGQSRGTLKEGSRKKKSDSGERQVVREGKAKDRSREDSATVPQKQASAFDLINNYVIKPAKRESLEQKVEKKDLLEGGRREEWGSGDRNSYKKEEVRGHPVHPVHPVHQVNPVNPVHQIRPVHPVQQVHPVPPPKHTDFPSSPVQNHPPKPVVGTSCVLEKSYFRLNGDPNPSQIRPRPILEQALVAVITKYKNGLEDHLFVIDQFRSIRQVL